MTRKTPKKISPPYLRRVLAWYVERYDAPVAHVRRLMMQRVRRAVAHHGQDLAECTAWLDEALAEFVRHGMLDDRRWAEAAVARWKARGVSVGQLRSRMTARGVPRDLVEELTTESRDDERLTALRYARRRGFGPWRRPDVALDEPRRKKELSAMARAGFGYALARGIVDDDDRDGAEDELIAAG